METIPKTILGLLWCGLEKVINREVTPVNKEKIAKLAQMWRLLPLNPEFWQFFAIDSCLVYILGKRQKFHEKIC